MDIRFGPFQLDLAGRQLLRDGRRVPLPPKVYHLLCVLAEERPRALSRQELHARLWPGTFVSDVNLACLVAELRTALGEWRRLVRTVHRFGYAFDLPAAAGPPAGPASNGSRAVVLVLPVVPLDGNADTAAIAVELTDDLTTRLGGVPWLCVMSLCASAALAREPLDLPRLVRERHVRFVVEASVRHDAGGLRVNARLIDAASSGSLWSDRLLTTASEVPDLHATLAGSLLEAMLAAQPGGSAAALAAPPADTTAAASRELEAGEEEPTVGHA